MTAATLQLRSVIRGLGALHVAAVLVLAVVPFLLVFAISFGHKVEGAAWVWGFELTNYRRFFVGSDYPDSISLLYVKYLWYSVWYALVAAILAVATAFPFVWLMTRLSRPAQTVWLVFFLCSLTFSEVFIVMGWDILMSNRSGLPMVFQETGLTDWLKANGGLDLLRDWGLATPRNVRFKPSEFATILTLTYLVWPYAVILLYPPVSKIEREVVEAARTMGASPFTVVRTVVMPMVRIPLVGAVLLLFVFLLGAYVTIAVFADPSKHTLSISIYEAVRGSTLNAPFGSAQAMILLLTAAAVLVIGQRFLSAKSGGR
ncbi:ABC transporter permease [Ruegeria arenilitoris]|uniref:Spermidine/putrescine transport system permease protein PotB n=1 Tax=Ruegeria arenilitoris TaxID=1173585 RepID=A0A238KP37_9RHOB|nr:ABC transporter permease subunit [Ruegeria arenilitoris]SMX44565.1 Spermidine/putrescine transport system permease protein PotB [Ruegeria arenilitoris]